MQEANDFPSPPLSSSCAFLAPSLFAQFPRVRGSAINPGIVSVIRAIKMERIVKFRQAFVSLKK